MTAVICSSKETPPDEPDTPQPNGIIDDGQNDNRSDGLETKKIVNSESPGESKQDDEGEEGGRSRDLSEEESEDDDDDGDNRLPQPDINTGQNECHLKTDLVDRQRNRGNETAAIVPSRYSATLGKGIGDRSSAQRRRNHGKQRLEDEFQAIRVNGGLSRSVITGGALTLAVIMEELSATGAYESNKLGTATGSRLFFLLYQTKMPLHRIYHAPGAIAQDDKKAIAAGITEFYTKHVHLPAFYVVVLFIEVDKESYFVGGKPNDKFVRISIQHIARSFESHRKADEFLGIYEQILAPTSKPKDWTGRCK
uniref:Tautomerase cis-CaaD-like domain-containing protein n=1 Tax=Ditylenchus dipsaci TaxID=166011 RepID=A0A915EC09_9BILA